MEIETKFTIGNKRFPVKLIKEKGRVYLIFKYNPELITEIKAMDGHKWHGFEDPPRKCWSIKDNARNRFQLDFFMGKNPYAPFDAPLIELNIPPRFNKALGRDIELYDHQKEMVRHFITRRYAIAACEMGTGKSLAFLTAMELTNEPTLDNDWWLVAPTSALKAVALECEIWGFSKPIMYTYDGLRTLMAKWPEGKKAPRRVVFDESSRIKTPNAQRSQAAYALAEGVREDWGDKGMVILATGSPAPKSPADWFHQSEVAYPGFLREGTYPKFKDRLGLIVQKESIATGGVYPHLVTWKDSELKCGVCGEYKEHPNHDPKGNMVFDVKTQVHSFQQGVNEVALLYKRMQGLVLVKMKKDCLTLPDKMYKILRLNPDQSTLNAARIISAKARTTIQALTLLRELSDGFQYKDEVTGRKPCEHCQASGKTEEWTGPEGQVLDPNLVPEEQWKEWLESKEVKRENVECPVCFGEKETDILTRTVTQIPCPKQDAYIDYLEEMEDIGNARAVAFGGFTGTIDRMLDISHQAGWNTIRVDGRGWIVTDPKGNVLNEDPLKLFQISSMERVAFIGHPESGGMGITLTKCPATFYYSNDFKAENRIQSEDRIHRPGMDTNRGATIIDCIHLPTDQLILDNLKKKRDLQSMAMGQLVNTFTLGERVI
jgi:hypothetical protein